MALNVDDVLQVSIRGTLFGQRILNIFHYVVSVTGAGNTLDQLQEIATDLGADTTSNGFIALWQAAVTANYSLDEIRVQRIYPARTIYQRSLPNVNGLHAGVCPSANIAVSIQKRGSLSGRTSQGRMQLAGIGSNGMLAGELDLGVYGVVLADLRDALAANQTTTTTPITIIPVIYNPAGPNPKYQLIQSWLINTSLRTMHRRTLFLGE